MQGPTKRRSNSVVWLRDYVDFDQTSQSTLKAAARAPSEADKFLLWDDVLGRYTWVNARHIVANQLSDITSLDAGESVYKFDTEAGVTAGDDRYVFDFSNNGTQRLTLDTDEGNLHFPNGGGVFTGGVAKSEMASKGNFFNRTNSGVLSAFTGVQSQLAIRPDTGSAGTSRGGTFLCKWENSGTMTGTMSEVRGGYFYAAMQKDNATVTVVNGGYFQTAATSSLSTGSDVIIMDCLKAVWSWSGTNYTIYNARGLFVESPSAPGSGTTIYNLAGLEIGDLKSYGTPTDAINIAAQTLGSATNGNIRMLGGNWNTGHVQLGAAHIWFDGTTLYGKVSAPTGSTDGTSLLGTGSFPGFTSIDTDYGNETVTSDWIFQGGAAAGDYAVAGDIDLTIGNSANYGIAAFGNSFFGRTSRVTGVLDLDGTVVLVNDGNPATSNILFAMLDGTNSIRFALPQSAVGNATYNPRSLLCAGPAPVNDECVTVSYWQGIGIFDNLACDTSGSGADLGVQNDLEVEGTIYGDTIAESTSAAGVTIDGLLVKDGAIAASGVPSNISITRSKGITIESPTSSEDLTWFFTDRAITVSAVRAVLANGSATPTVTYQVFHSTDRSLAGTGVTTSAAVTSVTTGTDATLSDTTIPTDSWVWIETTAQGGTTPELALSIEYADD